MCPLFSSSAPPPARAGDKKIHFEILPPPTRVSRYGPVHIMVSDTAQVVMRKSISRAHRRRQRETRGAVASPRHRNSLTLTIHAWKIRVLPLLEKGLPCCKIFSADSHGRVWEEYGKESWVYRLDWIGLPMISDDHHCHFLIATFVICALTKF